MGRGRLHRLQRLPERGRPGKRLLLALRDGRVSAGGPLVLLDHHRTVPRAALFLSDGYLLVLREPDYVVRGPLHHRQALSSAGSRAEGSSECASALRSGENRVECAAVAETASGARGANQGGEQRRVAGAVSGYVFALFQRAAGIAGDDVGNVVE